MTAYDLKLYTCQDCQHHLGNKKFNETTLNNYKYRSYKRLVCTQCKKIRGATAVRHREKGKARTMKDLAQGMKNHGGSPRPGVNGKRVRLYVTCNHCGRHLHRAGLARHRRSAKCSLALLLPTSWQISTKRYKNGKKSNSYTSPGGFICRSLLEALRYMAAGSN